MSSRANWSGEVSSRERDVLSVGSSSIPAPGHSVGSRHIIASTKQPSRTIRATWLFSRRALWHLERGLRLRTDVAFGSNATGPAGPTHVSTSAMPPFPAEIVPRCKMLRRTRHSNEIQVRKFALRNSLTVI